MMKNLCVRQKCFFDVKTTSPFPHRFFVWNKYQKEKAEKVKQVLSCIMGYKYMQW